MDRRQFVGLTGLISASAILSRYGLGQQSKRAAVVIGVDKCRNLVKLNAAASGARKFAAWLESEGFEVNRFIDGVDGQGDPIKVKVNSIFESIEELIAKGTFEQLVVYFSGHGFLNNYTEYWMLSDAPVNPNQAINLQQSEFNARRQGIRNVVFIADTCRSTPNSLSASGVVGGSIFPATDLSSPVSAEVDIFYAAQPGDPALEVGVAEAAGSYYGIFTESFLHAFRAPKNDMVTTNENGDEVILNRNLRSWLQSDVDRRAQLISLSRSQIPESQVESLNYIGLVRREANAEVDLPDRPTTFSDSAGFILNERGFDVLASTELIDSLDKKKTQIQRSKKTTDFYLAASRIDDGEKSAPKSFETQTGLYVSGAVVEEVVGNKDLAHVEIALNKEPGAIRVDPRPWQPASVAIRFADGSGTVVAALPGYIGTIVVDDGRVVNVSYLPSGLDVASDTQATRLAELRRLVAASARFGTFQIPGAGDERRSRADNFGDNIRMLKGIDPTLGIYAAYAYFEAQQISDVRSVMSFMDSDIGGRVFDVAMLADTLTDSRISRDSGVAPFCPMLSQGWNFVSIARIALPDSVMNASRHVRPALWTTFEPPGMDFVWELLESGTVQ